MGKIANIEMTKETEAKVLSYATANYDNVKKASTVIIKEYDNHFSVSTHVNGSPLILGKDII